MKINKIFFICLIGGIGLGTVTALFMDSLTIIPGIIFGLISGIFAWILFSKVDKSSEFPYWKADEQKIIKNKGGKR